MAYDPTKDRYRQQEIAESPGSTAYPIMPSDSVPDGSYLLVRARRVWVAGTTASSIAAITG